ncbi:MAG: energy-coupling factor ABC transporter permease [Candidatus Omnitrophica bacterium]|nr:energy-coupling factor ABC transporter permease [Candidatus Omnitrophota bacterium]
MHIPDGFLAANVWAPAWIFSIGGLAFCIRKTKELLKERMIPLMGVVSAFIFAAQMLNFPVIGGTSGHLLGGVLAAVLVGPYAAAVCLSCVLIVQCLIFQDGGVAALGANIFNMSIMGTLGGYLVYRIITKISGGSKGLVFGIAAASWFSVFIAASFCAFELAISGTSPLKVVLPAMVGIHSLIGIGEAIITVLVVSFVLKVRPDLIYKNTGN